MDIRFDISSDEVPIFLAETEEHLQVLEEGLVQLENEEENPDLLQSLFRAAHTIKGSAGMIGHKRLVEVTHSLETIFDGLRKHNLAVQTSLIDSCLKSVDVLRSLRDEVINGQESDVNVQEAVEATSKYAAKDPVSKPSWPCQPVAVAVVTPVANESPKTITVCANISKQSIAPAARAFQIMMALQENGQIARMVPSQEQIESMQPVTHFEAQIIPNQSIEVIRKELMCISEVENLEIIEDVPEAVASIANSTPTSPEGEKIPDGPEPVKDNDNQKFRLGDYLVEKGYITKTQLDEAVQAQHQEIGSKLMLGEILVRLGMISKETLDQVIAELLPHQRSVPKPTISSEADKPKDQLKVEKTVRTSVERLDKLMNLVGELITERNRLYQIRHQLENYLKGDDRVGILSDVVAHLSRLTDQLQEEVMHIRMQPVASLFNKFPRMVRDLAQKTGKEVDLVISGQETEFDRSVIEIINDPLIHLIRNAIDHGVETPDKRVAAGKPARGTLTLSARHEQGHIILTVEDDGGGINAEKLKASAVKKGILTESEAHLFSEEQAVDLIFLPGISTSEKVTDVSGRGVGMDIVRNNIERLNGTISVFTKPGQGTQFQISLPLTLAIVPTLLVKVSGITFAIPLITIVETQRLTPEDIQTIHGKPVTLLRNQILSLVSLADIFGLEDSNKTNRYSYTVVVRSSKLQVGLIVDALVGEEEVVVKSLGSLIGEIPGISSAAILGDGQISLIVDVKALFKMAGLYI